MPKTEGLQKTSPVFSSVVGNNSLICTVTSTSSRMEDTWKEPRKAVATYYAVKMQVVPETDHTIRIKLHMFLILLHISTVLVQLIYYKADQNFMFIFHNVKQ